MKKKKSYAKQRKLIIRVVALICSVLLIGSVLATAMFTAGTGA